MPNLRIPWSYPLSLADSGLSGTPRRINVLDQIVGDKRYTIRRPGLASVFSTTPGVGQGLHLFNGQMYAIIDDNLLLTVGPNNGSTGATWINVPGVPWAAREDFRTVTVNGVLFIMGGLDDNGDPLNDVWSVQPGQGWKLCTAAAPWAGRTSFMLGFINDTIYVIGGVKAGGIVCTDCWSSTDGSSWTLVTDKIVPDDPNFGARYGCGCISADNGIYLIGGRRFDNASIDTVIFSTDGLDWKECTNGAQWSGREFMATWYFQNALWIGGGETGGTPINEVWSSTDGGRNWVETAASPFDSGISFPGFCVYANKMWLINGADGMSVLNDVYSSPDGITWTKVTSSGPWEPSSSGVVVVFETATNISAYNYQTMYWLGGLDAGGDASSVSYYADLDTKLGASTPINPPIDLQPYQFASFNNGTRLLLKNQSGMWVIDGGTLIPVTDLGYPVETAPGLVVLGGFAYVCDPSGLIRNCDLNDPYHWPMLNAVGADYEDDRVVAITKYLNYLVAFGQYTLQFFYDAAVAVGSPLLPYLSSNMEIGCAAAETVCNVGPTVAWVSRTREFNPQVMILNGLTPQVISTPAIDQLLGGDGDFFTLTAVSAYADGHLLYIISGMGNGTSLVYDFSTREWFEWSRTTTEPDGLPFGMAASAGALDQVGTLLLDKTDGNVYAFSLSYTNDDGALFMVNLTTLRTDGGNNRNKFWGQTVVIGDKNTGSPEISWSDDDYQNFSTPRTVDMNTQRPCLYRNGSSRRRIFRYEQADSNPIRLEALEIDFDQGV